jgi:hypothetical protein
MTIALGEFAGADTDPATLDRYSRILAGHARLDSGLTLGRLVELAHDIAAAGPARTRTDHLPVQAATSPAGANVLYLAPGADQILHSYGSDASSDPTGVTTGSTLNPAVPFTPC